MKQPIQTFYVYQVLNSDLYQVAYFIPISDSPCVDIFAFKKSNEEF